MKVRRTGESFRLRSNNRIYTLSISLRRSRVDVQLRFRDRHRGPADYIDQENTELGSVRFRHRWMVDVNTGYKSHYLRITILSQKERKEQAGDTTYICRLPPRNICSYRKTRYEDISLHAHK